MLTYPKMIKIDKKSIEKFIKKNLMAILGGSIGAGMGMGFYRFTANQIDVSFKQFALVGFVIGYFIFGLFKTIKKD